MEGNRRGIVKEREGLEKGGGGGSRRQAVFCGGGYC